MKLKYNVNYHGFDYEYEITYSQYSRCVLEFGYVSYEEHELEQMDDFLDFVKDMFLDEVRAEYHEHVTHTKEIEADKRRVL